MPTDTSPMNDCQSETTPTPPSPDWEKLARYYQNQVKNLRIGLEYKSFVLDLTVKCMSILEDKKKDLASKLEYKSKYLRELDDKNMSLNARLMTVAADYRRVCDERDKTQALLTASQGMERALAAADAERAANIKELREENEKLKKDSDFWADESQKLAAQVTSWRTTADELDDKLHDADENLKDFLKENAELSGRIKVLFTDNEQLKAALQSTSISKDYYYKKLNEATELLDKSIAEVEELKNLNLRLQGELSAQEEIARAAKEENETLKNDNKTARQNLLKALAMYGDP